MNGIHLIADCYVCDGDLTNAKALRNACREAITNNQLTIVGESWVPFPGLNGQPGGVTGALVLAESHLAIHTWPEDQKVTLDIYVCNHSRDNSSRASAAMQEIIKYLKANVVERNDVVRGVF